MNERVAGMPTTGMKSIGTLAESAAGHHYSHRIDESPRAIYIAVHGTCDARCSPKSPLSPPTALPRIPSHTEPALFRRGSCGWEIRMLKNFSEIYRLEARYCWSSWLRSGRTEFWGSEGE